MDSNSVAICGNCGKTIVLSTFCGMGCYEPDYDSFDDPIVWRHANGYAACSTSFAAPK